MELTDLNKCVLSNRPLDHKMDSQKTKPMLNLRSSSQPSLRPGESEKLRRPRSVKLYPDSSKQTKCLTQGMKADSNRYSDLL